MTAIPVLTLWQPWAQLVAIGAKSIETRGWRTSYRGRLAIHAAARVPSRGLRLGDCWQVGRPPLAPPELYQLSPPGALLGLSGLIGVHPLPLGAIVATAELVDVVPIYGPFGDRDVPVCVRGGGPWSDDEQPGRLTLVAGELGGEAVYTDILHELPLGDYRGGRSAWLLDRIEPLPEPVPFKGGQALSRKWTP